MGLAPLGAMGLVAQGQVVLLFPLGFGGSQVAFAPLFLALGRGMGEGKVPLCPVSLKG